MSDYTLKKLTDVEDSAPKFGIEGAQARFAAGAYDAERTGFAYFVLDPGQRQPFGHKHDEAEEVYVVVAGSGRVKLDDNIEDIEQLDAIRVSPGVTRAFEAGPNGLEYLAFGARHEGDGELLHGWWTD
jgi:mannose-6-phosphate isomerase-like protein (cupin superfamily)